MDMKIGRKYIATLVAILIVVVVGAVAATSIGPQNGQPIGNGSISGNCATLTPSQTQALSGTYNGAILFDCSTFGFEGWTSFSIGCQSASTCQQTPAFTVGSTANLRATTLMLGSYSKLFYYPHATTYPFPGGFGGTSCSASIGSVQITGSPQTVPAGEYNYCAEFISVPPNGLAMFSIAWNSV